MSMTVTSAAPIGSEVESVSGWVSPMRRAVSMMTARPAFAELASFETALPISTDMRTGIELIERASAETSGSEPEKERL